MIEVATVVAVNEAVTKAVTVVVFEGGVVVHFKEIVFIISLNSL